MSFLAADHQGTQTAVVTPPTGAITRRRTTPFGARPGRPRRAWPGDKGFVGGTKDTTTGLTHLGAREYDPGSAGSSPPTRCSYPTTRHSSTRYQYARNNPVTFSDPTGSAPAGGGRGTSRRRAAARAAASRPSAATRRVLWRAAGSAGQPQAGTPVPAADEAALARRGRSRAGQAETDQRRQGAGQDRHGRARHHRRAGLRHQRRPRGVRRDASSTSPAASSVVWPASSPASTARPGSGRRASSWSRRSGTSSVTSSTASRTGSRTASWSRR